MLSRELREISDYKVLFEVLNATEVRAIFYTPVEFTSDYTCIISDDGTRLISLFDEISLPIDAELSSIYKIKYIEQLSPKTFNLITDKHTKTSKFLLPILSNNQFTKNTFLYDTYFVNCYLSEDLKHLHLIYRYSESIVFQTFEKLLKEHPDFISKKDINYQNVMITFKINPEFSGVVTFFINGKYSKFHEDYKQTILRFFGYNKTGKMAQILYKSSKRREQLELDFGVPISRDLELFSIPDLMDEVYVE
jgi:hypothetical protein